MDCTGNDLLRPRWKDISRRARLVADGTGLENRKGFTLLVGSNPTPSALKVKRFTCVSSVGFQHETSKKFWEASPSPVHGTRLLSGRGIKPPRGFKSLRLRRFIFRFCDNGKYVFLCAIRLVDKISARSSTDRASDYGSEG